MKAGSWDRVYNSDEYSETISFPSHSLTIPSPCHVRHRDEGSRRILGFDPSR